MSQNKSEPYKFFFRPKIVTKYIVGITLIYHLNSIKGLYIFIIVTGLASLGMCQDTLRRLCHFIVISISIYKSNFLLFPIIKIEFRGLYLTQNCGKDKNRLQKMTVTPTMLCKF